MAEKNTPFLPVLSEDWWAKVNQLKEDMGSKLKDISKTETPSRDGSGTKIIDQKPDGAGGKQDYIIEAYMREQLDKHFPGWSWEGMLVTPMGSEWLLAQGHLIIIDENLLPFGIVPPVRKFHGVGAARIQFKRGMAHSPENVVDIDKNIKSANSAALKYAINRLCHIGDDVYRKRIDEEGAVTEAEFTVSALANGDREVFMNEAKKLGFTRPSVICEKLGVRSLDEIEDYQEALSKLKEVDK